MVEEPGGDMYHQAASVGIIGNQNVTSSIASPIVTTFVNKKHICTLLNCSFQWIFIICRMKHQKCNKFRIFGG